MAGICNVHGCPQETHRLGRCRDHVSRYDAHQRRTVPTKVTEPADRARRARAVREHIRKHGPVCLGDDQHGPHRCTDLTAHHVRAVAGGGAPHGELQVLCRSRNSAIGSRTDR